MNLHRIKMMNFHLVLDHVYFQIQDHHHTIHSKIFLYLQLTIYKVLLNLKNVAVALEGSAPVGREPGCFAAGPSRCIRVVGGGHPLFLRLALRAAGSTHIAAA